jgi:polysaccharide pyruvyl transferase WcaK-like protein
MARAFGVRIAALGVGISSLSSPFARRLMRSIIGMSELFLVRDQAALDQCFGTKAQLSNDLVFAWQAAPRLAFVQRPQVDGAIAITVYPPEFSGADGETLANSFTQAMLVWNASRRRLAYLVCQNSDNVVNDGKIFADLTAMMRDENCARNIELRHLSANPDAIEKTFADVGVVCGMRFHALVLAALLNRPFVGIAHDNKIAELCRYFRMPCLDAKTFSGADLVTAVESVRDRVPDPALVSAAMNSAKDNFRLFAKIAP